MSQSYLIFSEGRRIEIQRGAEKVEAIYDGRQEKIDDGELQKKVTNLVAGLEKGEFSELCFTTTDVELLFEKIKSAYDRFIIAAGGLVINRAGKLLLIFRKGKWDLPKGKIEKNERINEGALREVMEETGLKRVNIKNEFLRTYHTYVMNEERILKETVWYLMTTDDDKTTPQLNEGITATKWISADMLEEISTNTFDNILLLLRTFFKDIP